MTPQITTRNDMQPAVPQTIAGRMVAQPMLPPSSVGTSSQAIPVSGVPAISQANVPPAQQQTEGGAVKQTLSSTMHNVKQFVISTVQKAITKQSTIPNETIEPGNLA